MKRLALFLALLAAGCAAPIGRDVAFLADPALEGRDNGSEGARKAGEYIAAGFRGAGVETSFQPFSVHGFKGRNVIGIVPGETKEAVVIGAHYDHLGYGKDKESTRGTPGKIHPGADDNASGTAVLLEMARRFGRRPARRTILLIAFSAEEDGLVGSMVYVNHPVRPAVAMINLDMVGRLRKRLTVLGADSGTRFREYLADSPTPLDFGTAPVGGSDHMSFNTQRIPAVHFFTGLHDEYHTERDTLDTLNIDGMIRIADVVETLARRIADAPDAMEWRHVKVATANITPGARPYFGSIPDYGYSGKGARLSGVAPEGPAEKAGLKAGDVIIALDGRDTPDINVYSEVLFSRKAGAEVEVVFLRDGKRHTVKATLMARKPGK